MKFQKTAAVFLFFLLLFGTAPAYAADSAANVLNVNDASIEGYVRSSNQTIRANSKTLDAMKNNDLAEQKIDDLQNSVSQLSGVGTMLQQADAAVKVLPSSAESQAIDTSLQGSIASIDAISSILGSEEDQLETDGEKVDETELEMDDAADQIVVAAQKLFLTYNTLNSQRTVLNEQQQVLADELKADQVKADVGLMTQTDLLNAQQQKNAAGDQLAVLISQMKTVKDNLRVLMGYSSDYDLNIASVPQADADFIAKMDYEADYQTAVNVNWTLLEKQKAIDVADEDYDSGLSSTVDAHNAAALQYQLAQNTFDTSFRQAFDDVAQKQALLASAQSASSAKEKALENIRQQNALGVASALDLENAQFACDSAAAGLVQAQINFFASQEQYDWARRGVLSQSSSSQS